MANFFDQFDGVAQASPPAQPAPQGQPAPNFFDQFDAAPAALDSAPSLTIRPQGAAAMPDDPSAGGRSALDIVEGTGPDNYATGADNRSAGQRAQFALDAAIDGIPFSDRAAAAVQTYAPFVGHGSYSDNLAAVRGREAARMQQDPAAENTLSMVGGMALPVPAVGPVAGAASVLGRIGRGALAGGILGGVQGASSSPDLTKLGQTAMNTGLGVGIGAGLGGALPLAAQGVGKVARMMRGDVVPTVPGVVPAARNMALDAISKDGAASVLRHQDLYGDPGMMFDYGPSLRGLGQGLATKDGPAASTVVDALGYRQAATNSRVRQGLADNFGPAQDPAAVAQQIKDFGQAATQPYFARSYLQDQPWSPDLDALSQRPAVASALRDAATTAANQGRPFPTITLNEHGQPVSSDAALAAYDAGTRPAITGALGHMLGVDPAAGPLATGDALKAARSAAADPLYAAWRSTPVPLTPDLAEVLGRPSVQRAIPGAQRKAADQGRSIFAQDSRPQWERDPLGPDAVPDAPQGASQGLAAPGPNPDDMVYGAPTRPQPPQVPRPQDARGVIRRLGGVRDLTGDLTAAGVDEVPGAGPLIRPVNSGKGVTSDQASEILAQLGYFGADKDAALRGRNASTLADVLTNHPSYPVGPEADAWAAHDQNMADWNRWKSETAGQPRYQAVPPQRGPLDGFTPDAMGMGPSTPGPGKGSPQLTAEGLDYVKRTLDDKISSAQRAGRHDDVRIFTGLKNDLIGAVDQHPDPTVQGAWQAARQAYAGPTRELSALDAGKAALGDGVTREQMAREFGALGTDGERAQYRNGLFHAMKEKLGKASDTANFVNTVAGNQTLRDKFAVVAPHAAALTHFNSVLDRARQTFTEATRPTVEGWHGALQGLDARAASDPGAAAARDALGTHLGQIQPFAKGRALQQDYSRLGEALDYGRQSMAAGDGPIWPGAFSQRFGAMSPAEQETTRIGQRGLMEEAIGTKPNDQLAMKGMFQTGNTPAYTAPGVSAGNPDLAGWNAQKLATSFGHRPVANMQELLNANDAFNNTFTKVAQNAETARRRAMVKALEDADWKPRDLIDTHSDHATVLGLVKQTGGKVVNTLARMAQSPVSNVARDADLARIGTMTGLDRNKIMADLLRALPARESNNALETMGQRATLYGGAIAAGAITPAMLAKALRDYKPPDQR